MSGSSEPPHEDCTIAPEAGSRPSNGTDLPLAPSPAPKPPSLFEEEELIELPHDADKAGNGMDIDVLPLPMSLDLEMVSPRSPEVEATLHVASPKPASPSKPAEEMGDGLPPAIVRAATSPTSLPVMMPRPVLEAQVDAQHPSSTAAVAPAPAEPAAEHPERPHASPSAGLNECQIPSGASTVHGSYVMQSDQSQRRAPRCPICRIFPANYRSLPPPVGID